MKERAGIIKPIPKTRDIQADLNQAGKIGLAMVITFAGLVGTWGLACMIGALSSQGIGQVIHGVLSAINGM